jgi:hypothetical protein
MVLLRTTFSRLLSLGRACGSDWEGGDDDERGGARAYQGGGGGGSCAGKHLEGIRSRRCTAPRLILTEPLGRAV